MWNDLKGLGAYALSPLGAIAGNIATELRGGDANWLPGLSGKGGVRTTSGGKVGVTNYSARPTVQRPYIGTSSSSNPQSDPNANQQPGGGGDVWYGNTGYYGGGGIAGGYAAPSRPAYDQSTVDQFDSGISSLESAMGRLDGQLNIARDNVVDQFNQSRNRLNSARDAAQNQYKTGSTTNMQSLRTNKNNIMDQQSQGLRGLLRTLGMYGAVGSDAQVGSGLVADQATQQRSGAGSIHAQNQRSLDTNWGTFKKEDEGRRRELEDWKTRQIRTAEQQSNTTRQDLLTRLAELRGQREATIGGSYKGAAQPYLDQANALSSTIDNLGRFKPTFSGSTPVYKAPTLDSYRMGEGPTIDAGGQPVGQTPALNALLGLGRGEEEDRVLF